MCVWGGGGVAMSREKEGRKQGRSKRLLCIVCVGFGFFYECGFLFRIFFYGVVKVAIIPQNYLI